MVSVIVVVIVMCLFCGGRFGPFVISGFPFCKRLCKEFSRCLVLVGFKDFGSFVFGCRLGLWISCLGLYGVCRFLSLSLKTWPKTEAATRHLKPQTPT